MSLPTTSTPPPSSSALYQRAWRKANPTKCKTYQSKWRKANPTKFQEGQSKWRRANYGAYRESDRRSKFKARYGITPEQKDEMLALQGGVCAICRTDKPGGNGWHTDHDHQTKQLRSILCHGCNVGLGHFRDNPAILLAAVEYLRKFQNGGQEDTAS